MVAIFTYGFEVAEKNFKKANVELHTLSDYNEIVEQAEKSGYITTEERALLVQWRDDPANWDPKMAIKISDK